MTIGVGFCVEPYGVGVVFDTRAVTLKRDADGDLEVHEVISERVWKLHSPARTMFVGIAGSQQDARELLERLVVPDPRLSPRDYIEEYRGAVRTSFRELVRSGRFGPGRPCEVQILIGGYSETTRPHSVLAVIWFERKKVYMHCEAGEGHIFVIGGTPQIRLTVTQKVHQQFGSFMFTRYEEVQPTDSDRTPPPELPDAIRSHLELEKAVLAVEFRPVESGGELLSDLWAGFASRRAVELENPRHPSTNPVTLWVSLARVIVGGTVANLKSLDRQMANSIGDHFVCAAVTSRGFQIFSDPIDPVIEEMLSMYGIPRAQV